MKILICCDNARRDLLSSKLLAKKMAAAGHSPTLCNGRTLRILFRMLKPDITILSRTDYPIAKAIGKASKLLIVPSEGARLTKETMLSVFIGRNHYFNESNQRLDQNNDVIENFDFVHKLFLWGKHTYKFLMESGFFRPEQLLISGNPRLDVYQNYKLKNKPKTKTIGIAITVKSVSSYYGKVNYLEMLSESIKFGSTNTLPMVPKNRYWEDYAWRDFAIARISMNAIDSIIRDTDYKIKIRVNPFENFNDYLFLKEKYKDRVIIDPPDYQLNEFLNEIDVLITCWSTTGVESLISEVPVISLVGLLDQEHLMTHIDPVANGFESFLPLYYRPKSSDELLEYLSLVKEDKLDLTPELKLFNQYVGEIYNWPCSQEASEIIIEEINRTKAKYFKNSKLDDILLFNKYTENIMQMNVIFEKLVIHSIYFFKILMNNFDDYIKNYGNHYRYFYKLINKRIDVIISESGKISSR